MVPLALHLANLSSLSHSLSVYIFDIHGETVLRISQRCLRAPFLYDIPPRHSDIRSYRLDGAQYFLPHGSTGLCLDPWRLISVLIFKLYLLSYISIYPPNSLPIYGLAHLNLRFFLLLLLFHSLFSFIPFFLFISSPFFSLSLRFFPISTPCASELYIHLYLLRFGAFRQTYRTTRFFAQYPVNTEVRVNHEFH